MAKVYEGCRSAGIGCIECKGWAADALVQVLQPIQERRASFTEAQVKEILKDGSNRARIRAEADHGAGARRHADDPERRERQVNGWNSNSVVAKGASVCAGRTSLRIWIFSASGQLRIVAPAIVFSRFQRKPRERTSLD